MNPTNYFPDVAQNVQNIVDSLASGVEAIYDIYGIEAINALQEGFGSLEHYGTVLGSGFNVLDSLSLSLCLSLSLHQATYLTKNF